MQVFWLAGDHTYEVIGGIPGMLKKVERDKRIKADGFSDFVLLNSDL
ncbi:hypothetical protein [Pseudoalteromonas sp. NBT06-2]|nr:hypothetical protein [Pseudoalteromonas sp. NBT06-2]